MQKKSIKIFSNCKNKHAKKKHQIIFQKKMQKKAEMQKKKMQKQGGCISFGYPKPHSILQTASCPSSPIIFLI